jgi:hypothetical protein
MRRGVGIPSLLIAISPCEHGPAEPTRTCAPMRDVSPSAGPSSSRAPAAVTHRQHTSVMARVAPCLVVAEFAVLEPAPRHRDWTDSHSTTRGTS